MPPASGAWAPRRPSEVLERDPETGPRRPLFRPPAPLPQFGEPGLRLLRRIGHVDPESLDGYRAHGGYAALRRALELGPGGVVREVIDSKLLGRGGAAFPTGRKWEAVAKASVRPHYLVCNADESEPGTFKDRVVMERDPFAVVEAMTIAGFATGCERGYLYVRGEYPLAAERLSHAIDARPGAGPPGRRRAGTGRAVRHRAAPRRRRLHLRRGDGPLQLHRGIPGRAAQQAPLPHRGRPLRQADGRQQRRDPGERPRRRASSRGPPTPRSAPTGRAARSSSASRGTWPGRASTRCPSARRWKRSSALAGGVPGGRQLRAVLLGGAAGSFVTPEELEMPLTFEGTRAIGASLGSGVVVALDDSVDLWGLVLRIAAFFRDESCGQCVPCRVGTVRQEEALHRLARLRPLGSGDDEKRAPGGDRPGHARRVDLRPGPDRGQRHRVGRDQARALERRASR